MNKTKAGEVKMTRVSTRLSSRSSKPQETPKNTPRTHSYIGHSNSDSETEEILKSKQTRTPTKKKSQLTDHEIQQLSPVTPPKQLKNDSGINPTTPSSLFKDLSLASPTEKTHTKHSRKSLFNATDTLKKSKNKENNSTDVDDEEKLQKDVRVQRVSVYESAKKALHSTSPTEMPGREKEHDELRKFIKTHLNNKTSASLYVSGPPGTGKTASLNLILMEEEIYSKTKQIYINCTSIKSASSIYSRLTKDLGIKAHGKTDDYLTSLEKYLGKNHKMIILVLDEIDQLETKNQSILYTIFEWPSKPSTQILLIGIANALDLTDRILPRLQVSCKLKPKLMHFTPYTKQQIVEIFTSRLKSSGVLDVFSPVALQMLAGKVAAVSGDVRKALDIGRRVVELVDQSRSSDILKPVENMVNDLIDKEIDEKPKAVDIKQVVNMLNNVYGTSQNLSDDSNESFPLQQKIIICSLLLILRKSKNKDVTIGKLHEVYRKVCTKRNILSVDQAEFVGLCSLIETRGIIRVSGKKEPRMHKVCLQWDEEEVVSALKDKQLISTILQDDSNIGKL